MSLVDPAAVAQASPAHFARLFKQATGQTPHQYVTTCRMECAKHLLTETTLLLHEVGAQVGYADQSYSPRCFGSTSAPLPRPTATPPPVMTAEARRRPYSLEGRSRC